MRARSSGSLTKLSVCLTNDSASSIGARKSVLSVFDQFTCYADGGRHTACPTADGFEQRDGAPL